MSFIKICLDFKFAKKTFAKKKEKKEIKNLLINHFFQIFQK